MADANLKAVITAEDQATPVFKRFQTSVGDIAKGVALGQLAFTGLKAAVGGVVGTLKGSIDSFQDSQREAFLMESVLISTKGAANQTTEALNKHALSLMNMSGVSDETISKGQRLLLTFTNIKDDVFPGATAAALNMSAALGQDMQSSAIQLGKALNDPINGITALRRVGVSFNDQQQEQIKTLVESGKTMEAQKLILNELETEFGGAAEAAGGTFGGQVNVLKENIDNMKERIGEAIVKGLTPFIEKITKFVNSPEGQKFIDNITASVDRFFAFLVDHKDQIGSILSGIGTGFKLVGEAISFVFKIISKMTEAISEAIFKVGQFADKAKNIPVLGKVFGKIADFAGFAEGGSFSSGNPIIVGERGPELIIPNTSGTVIPNHALGNIQINFNGGVSMQNNADIDEIGRRLAQQIRLVSQGAI